MLASQLFRMQQLLEDKKINKKLELCSQADPRETSTSSPTKDSLMEMQMNVASAKSKAS